jgi:hypothetical protein
MGRWPSTQAAPHTASADTARRPCCRPCLRPSLEAVLPGEPGRVGSKEQLGTRPWYGLRGWRRRARGAEGGPRLTAAVARGTAARGSDGTGAAIWHMLVPRVNLRGAVARRVQEARRALRRSGAPRLRGRCGCGPRGHTSRHDAPCHAHHDVMVRRVMRMRLLAAPRLA